MTDKTQAGEPERIWANGLGCYGFGLRGGTEYVRADMFAASQAKVERLKYQCERYKAACETAGVCMACVIDAPEPYGCTDCLNTGYDGNADHHRVAVLTAENERLMALFKTQSKVHTEHVKGLLAQHKQERDIYGKAAQDFRERAEKAEAEVARLTAEIKAYQAQEPVDKQYRYYIDGK